MYLAFLILLIPALTHGLLELSMSRTNANPSLRHGSYCRESDERFDKRDTIASNVFNNLDWQPGGSYYINVTVGSPPQNQTVFLSTASSDTFFNSFSVSACQPGHTDAIQACGGGSFHAVDSDTYQEISRAPAFNTSFVDGSWAVGPLASDVIGIGDVALSNAHFGIAETFESPYGASFGFLALGYYNNEAVDNSAYPNIIESMVQAGAINSRLFSIHLGSTADASGSILFGGVDTSKYVGNLGIVNILSTSSSLTFFDTRISDAEVNINDHTYPLWSSGNNGQDTYYNSSDARTETSLDPASSGWFLPQDLYDAHIQPHFSFVDQNGLCICDYANSNDTITLTFDSQVSVKFDTSELIVPLFNSTTGERLRFVNGTEACVFSISGTSGPYTMGNNMLKNMYVVFDMDNGQLGIAQALLGNTGPSNVTEVPAGPDGLLKAAVNVRTAPTNTNIVPTRFPGTATPTVSTLPTPLGTASGIDAVPLSAQVSLSTTIGPPASFLGTFTSTATGTSTNSAKPSSPSNPGPKRSSHVGAIAGGVVGGLAGLALIGGAAFLLLRKRKQANPVGKRGSPYETQQSAPMVQQQRNAML
ncbi:hypothetical protein AC579_6863 [Pseudocercospora musae]|uniref:Peptidase A1 domain-containing protein n=1 Tax=Pseudocercospora musae TaxID=113226 RepID=A0A139I9H5_9PEZI|nr:hypothetical protein AC579_6863 [Pseudocercospora musae]KXT11182.1 hypothetical protein AC579_6863 [Pseudocercospora musae]